MNQFPESLRGVALGQSLINLLMCSELTEVELRTTLHNNGIMIQELEFAQQLRRDSTNNFQSHAGLIRLLPS